MYPRCTKSDYDIQYEDTRSNTGKVIGWSGELELLLLHVLSLEKKLETVNNGEGKKRKDISIHDCMQRLLQLTILHSFYTLRILGNG